MEIILFFKTLLIFGVSDSQYRILQYRNIAIQFAIQKYCKDGSASSHIPLTPFPDYYHLELEWYFCYNK